MSTTEVTRTRVSPRVAFFVNSSLAFAASQLLTAALHEAGHGIVAQLLGFAPRIYAFYEDNPTGHPWQTLLILAGGPVASLVIGAIFWACYRMAKAHYSFARLLLTWLAISGVMTFVNYLIVTPFFSVGDTAQFVAVAGWPVWPRYVLMLIGIGLLLLLARPAAKAFFDIAPRSLPLETARDRRRFIMGGFYLPIFAGIALSAVAGIGTNPLNVFYELLETLGIIDIVALTLYAGVAIQIDAMRGDDAPLRIDPAAIGAYVVLVLAYVFAFSRGVPI